MMVRLVKGVDLGGTHVRAGVVRESGELLNEPAQNPSYAQNGYEGTLQAILHTMREDDYTAVLPSLHRRRFEP
jgi:predicted NBD/HSP70 family sugar kinase